MTFCNECKISEFRVPGSSFLQAGQDLNLCFEFRQLAGDNVPNDGVVHIVIPVDEAVAESNDLGASPDFGK